MTFWSIGTILEVAMANSDAFLYEIKSHPIFCIMHHMHPYAESGLIAQPNCFVGSIEAIHAIQVFSIGGSL